MTMEFKGKTVWITGASSGIGESLAYELARAGAKLILSARNQEALQRVRSSCAFPERHHVIPLDLEQYHSLEDLANQVWQEQGPIDVLINNGGISQNYLVADSTSATDLKIIETNCLGTIALTHPILKQMLKRNNGHIAVISSMLGFFGIQTRCAYSASKQALKGYFEGLRNELIDTKIKITVIYPGCIRTEVIKHALKGDGSLYGQDDRSHQKGIPVEQCARKIIDAIEQGKAEQIIAGSKERLGLFLIRHFPALFRMISPRFKI